MSRHNAELGLRGERIAVGFLKRNGYKILTTNFCSPLGQIDIVAKDGRALVFIEVKTRSSKEFGMPEEAVNHKKRRKMVSLAWFYLKKYNLGGLNCRFDVVSVLKESEKDFSINLIKNAFTEG